MKLSKFNKLFFSISAVVATLFPHVGFSQYEFEERYGSTVESKYFTRKDGSLELTDEAKDRLLIAFIPLSYSYDSICTNSVDEFGSIQKEFSRRDIVEFQPISLKLATQATGNNTGELFDGVYEPDFNVWGRFDLGTTLKFSYIEERKLLREMTGERTSPVYVGFFVDASAGMWLDFLPIGMNVRWEWYTNFQDDYLRTDIGWDLQYCSIGITKSQRITRLDHPTAAKTTGLYFRWHLISSEEFDYLARGENLLD